MAAASRRYPGRGRRSGVNFVRNRPIYPTVHLFAVLAALVVVIGLLALTRSFDRPGSSLFGQAAVVSATVGLAIFGVESTSEGLALPELADAASKVDPAQRVEFVRAAQCRGGSHSRTLSRGDGLDDRCSTPAARDRDGA